MVLTYLIWYQVLYDAVIENYYELATDRGGCLTVSHCIDSIESPQRGWLLSRICEESASLSLDPSGYSPYSLKSNSFSWTHGLVLLSFLCSFQDLCCAEGFGTWEQKVQFHNLQSSPRKLYTTFATKTWQLYCREMLEGTRLWGFRLLFQGDREGYKLASETCSTWIRKLCGQSGYRGLKKGTLFFFFSPVLFICFMCIWFRSSKHSELQVFLPYPLCRKKWSINFMLNIPHVNCGGILSYLKDSLLQKRVFWNKA